ncbi:MAG: T9SS type A sorting domain-containing protein [Candidatus Kapaibacterium sp.]
MRWVSLILILAHFSSVLRSEAQEDIRISPVEPLQYTIPPEYRLHDADSVNHHTLVVWGTTRPLNDNSVVGELRFQLFEGTTPATPQTTLTDSLARPIHHVQVISLAASFLILWEDHRADAPGLYAQRVDFNGMLIGKAERLSGVIAPHKIYGRTICVAGLPTKGRLLLWQESDGTNRWVNRLHVKAEGDFSLPVTQSEGTIEQVIHYKLLPGFAIVQEKSGLFAVTEAGEIDERPLIPSLFDEPFHITEDSTLYQVVNNNLYQFYTPFSPLPERELPLPQLDSALSSTIMIGRQSSGELRVIYGTNSETGERYKSGEHRTTLYSIEVGKGFTIDSMPIIFSESHISGAYTQSGSGELYNIEKIEYVQGESNTSLLRLTTAYTRLSHNTLQPPSNYIRVFSIGSNGEFYNDSSGFLLQSPASDVHTRRVDSVGIISIIVPVASDSISVQVLAPGWRRGTAQTSPKIVRTTEGIQLGWLDQDFGGILAEAGTALSHVTIIDSVIAPPIPYGFTAQDGMISNLSISPTQSQYRIYSLLNQLWLTNHKTECLSFVVTFTGTSWWEMTSVRYALFVYGGEDDEWKQRYTHGRKPVSYTDTKVYHRGEVLGELRGREEIVFGLFQKSSSSIAKPFDTLVAIDRKGNLTWRSIIPAFHSFSTLLPVDSAQVLMIQDTQAVMMRGEKTLYSFPLPPAKGKSFTTKLNDSTFLRTSSNPNLNSSLLLEKWSTAGTLLGSTYLPDAEEEFLTGNYQTVFRAEDGIIVLLRGTEENGLHATIFDNALQTVVRDTILSQWQGRIKNPAGLFDRENLILVWEDTRNGNPDIYGRNVLIPYRATNSTREETEEKAALWPNPTEDGIYISFSSRSIEPTTIELFDLLGQRIVEEQVSAGLSGVWIDLHGTKPGHYLVRWSSAGRSGAELVMVVR